MSSGGTSLKFRWRIPEYSGSSCKRVIKANRYLKHMDMHLSDLILKGDYFKATNVFMGMLRKSKSLRIYALNRFQKDWYRSIPHSQALRIVNRLDRFMKTLPLMVTLKRKYILKKSGKLRPLGIPDVAMRILNSLWAQYIYAATEHLIMDEQHGFRRGRGIWTAWQEIIERTKDKSIKIFEFDLKSFFNKVNPNIASGVLKRIDWRLAAYVEIVNRDSIPIFKEYHKEAEYTAHKGRIVRKWGLPQGLPWSPLLASLALSWAGVRNSIMYADDGLILYDPTKGENPMEILFDNPKLDQVGVKIEWDKSNFIDRYLTFGGLTADLHLREFRLPEGGTLPMDYVTEETLKSLTGKYYKNKNTNEASEDKLSETWSDHLKRNLITTEEVEWEWSCNNKSWLFKHFKSPWQIWPNFFRYIVRCLLRLLGLRKLGNQILPSYYHRYNGIIYDIRQVSTYASEWALARRWGNKYKRVIPRHTLRHLDTLDLSKVNKKIIINNTEYWLLYSDSLSRYRYSGTKDKYYMHRPRP